MAPPTEKKGFAVKEKKKETKREKRIRVSSQLKRFPRLYLTQSMMMAEKILHHVYNRLSEQRSSKKGLGGWYDIYKTKHGLMAPVKFMLLAQDLVNRKIDPSVYLKVMSQYGMYQHARFLPHPSWLAGSKAMEVYEWLHKREIRKHASQSDWTRSNKIGDIEDRREIIQLIKHSGMMVRDVKNSFNLKMYEAMLFLRSDLSPYYWATFLLLLKRKDRRDMIMDFLRAEEQDLYKEMMFSVKYYLANRGTWKVAVKTLRKYL